MCGVVALWNRDGRGVDLQALRGAVQSLGHRGPDDEGYVLINTRTGLAVACAGPHTDPAHGLRPLDDVRGGAVGGGQELGRGSGDGEEQEKGQCQKETHGSDCRPCLAPLGAGGILR